MLDEERRRAARSTFRDTARLLADPVRLDRSKLLLQEQTSYPAISRWRPGSLALGDVGMAVFAGVAAVEALDMTWDRLAHAHLARAVQAGLGGLSLYDGAVGLAAAVCLQRQRGGYQRLARQLSDHLLPRMQAVANAAAGKPQAFPSTGFDVVNGLAGWCAYLLLAEPTEPVIATTTAVAQALTAALTNVDDRGPLPTPASQLDFEQRQAAPYGYLDCGVAHGVAGVVAALALLRLSGRVTVPGLAAALQAGAGWLAGQAGPFIQGGHMPRVVLRDAAGRPGTPVDAGRPGWCYGAAGVSRALWLAGRALGEDGFRQDGVEVLRAALRPVESDRLVSPTICHGVAGLLLVTACFGWDGEGPELCGLVAGLVDRLLDAYRSEAAVGFRDVENTGAQVDSAGLLSGAAGVALTLQAVTSIAGWRSQRVIWLTSQPLSGRTTFRCAPPSRTMLDFSQPDSPQPDSPNSASATPAIRPNGVGRVAIRS